MKSLLTIFILFLACVASQAQIFDINIFGGSRDQVKDEVKRNKNTYQNIRKEQKEYLKDRKKAFKISSDSINKISEKKLVGIVSEDSIAQLKKWQEKHFVYRDTLYYLEDLRRKNETLQTHQDSLLRYAEDKLNGNHYYNKYMAHKEQISNHKKEFKTYRDSLKNSGFDKEEQEYLLELKKGELSKKYSQNLENEAKKELAERELMPVHETSTEMAELDKYKNLSEGFNPDELPTDVNTHGLKNIEPNQTIDPTKTQGISYFEGKKDLLDGAMSNMQDLKKNTAQP